MGKSKTEVFEIDLQDPVKVEQEYEARHTHPLERDVCKVIDVREVTQ